MQETDPHLALQKPTWDTIAQNQQINLSNILQIKTKDYSDKLLNATVNWNVQRVLIQKKTLIQQLISLNNHVAWECLSESDFKKSMG